MPVKEEKKDELLEQIIKETEDAILDSIPDSEIDDVDKIPSYQVWIFGLDSKNEAITNSTCSSLLNKYNALSPLVANTIFSSMLVPPMNTSILQPYYLLIFVSFYFQRILHIYLLSFYNLLLILNSLIS